MYPVMCDNADRIINAAVNHRFTPQGARDHYATMLIKFFRSGLCAPHMAQDIETGDDGPFWSFVWEAMLYRHLRSRGYEFVRGLVKKSGQVGPDFCIEHAGTRIWIEAVVPAPEGIPKEFTQWSTPGEVRVRSVPHEAIQLRWLSVMKDKQEKIARYIQDEVISAHDRTVIAVNACCLADHWVDDLGISQWPIAVEAVFPVGPIGVRVSRDGSFEGDPVQLTRHSIKIANNSHVPTNSFLNPALAHISAVVGCVQKDMMAGPLNLTLVHNPIAINMLPKRLLGAQKEFVTGEQGDQYVVRDIID
jgi:hypothetical protein